MAKSRTRPIRRRPSANSQATRRLMAAAATAKAITVNFPRPGTNACDVPFQASGVCSPGMQMDPTATISAPGGEFTGQLVSGTNWTYEFTDALPCGVPLALSVSGVDTSGLGEAVVVPFECDCAQP